MKATAFLLTALLFVACGTPAEEPTETQPATASAAAPAAPAPPSIADTKELIASSGTLGEFEFTKAAVTLPMQKSSMNEPQLADAQQLVKAGWLAFDGSGALVLAKAKDDKRFVVRPNGYLDVVPVAKKEMGDVTAVRPTTSSEAEADFTFRWVPTEVGTAFTSGEIAELFASPVEAKATLLWNGTRWDVLSIGRR